jgi:hypothetical protein
MEFEHLLQSESCTVIGKEVIDKLMAMTIAHRQDDDRFFPALLRGFLEDGITPTVQ